METSLHPVRWVLPLPHLVREEPEPQTWRQLSSYGQGGSGRKGAGSGPAVRPKASALSPFTCCLSPSSRATISVASCPLTHETEPNDGTDFPKCRVKGRLGWGWVDLGCRRGSILTSRGVTDGYHCAWDKIQTRPKPPCDWALLTPPKPLLLPWPLHVTRCQLSRTLLHCSSLCQEWPSAWPSCGQAPCYQ